ncbi:hypothetical protein E3E36_09835 [Thermococcus sp. M36]|uniref:hypothetical protein n=1 Tax=Thermococcus sp. M36 TaxID=1638261 RepID=UPI00143AA92E|nr:hypothetical protein [Thermococcus sp. M36]NJE06433.1 hypothetical protein [Thermococcus sp. M36]
MGFKRRVKETLNIWTQRKTFTYIRVRCAVLSDCMRRINKLLESKRVRYTVLFEPDTYLLTSIAEPLYERGNFLVLIELRDELSRAFYLIESDVPINLEGIPEVEFTIAFRLRKKEGLVALLRVIHERKVGGARHKHRSMLNFLTSFFGSLFLSTIMDFESYWVQFIIMIILTVLLYLVLDYPFSLLYFKGVEVVSSAKQSTKVFVIKVGRVGNKRS